MTSSRAPVIRNPVLLLLLIVGLAAASGLAFVSHAPNRLISGQPIALPGLLRGWAVLLCLPIGLLLASPLLPPTRRHHGLIALAGGLLPAGLACLAGQAARDLAVEAGDIGRTALGGGFWLLVLCSYLAALEAITRLGLSATRRGLAVLALWLPPLALLLSGQLDQTALLREYRNHHEIFDAALWRHGQIVALSLLASLALGVPLGLAASRWPRLRTPLFAVLNLIQTVPAIALFALLIAPLAALAASWPLLAQWGIAGIGMAPAVLALSLYALLPVARSLVAGLAGVSAAAIEAATGMGMSRWQIFWRVSLPLALPVLLAGLRITTVQVIGLAVLAALIGAGGFGAIIFQGLLGSALDLVLLGVLPVLALTLAVDAGFRLLTAMLEAPAR